MIKLLKRYLDDAKAAIRDRKNYFQYAKEEIAERNIHRIFQGSIITTFLTLILFILTPILFPAWRATAPYWILLGFTVITTFLSALYLRKNKQQYNVTMAVTVLFYIILALFCIYIDSVENPNSEAIYLPFLMVVLSIIFIVPVSTAYTINCVMALIFLMVDYQIKSIELYTNDSYTILLSLVFSGIAANLVMNLRCEDNLDKFRYKRLSSIDGLTETLNKENSTALVSEYINNREKGEYFALLIIDIDRFKDVNDKLGHQYGDVILGKIGHILLDSFRLSDIIGRVGGDEFMVLMRGITDRNQVEEGCRKVSERARKIDTGHEEVQISCSIGALITMDCNCTFEKCFDYADHALYEAKRQGRNCYVIQQLHEDISYERPIMIVADDDDANRAAVIEAFQNEYEVLQAKDGSEALALIDEYNCNIAIIMLDIYMPRMDGYELIRFMKARPRYKDIPIIVVSGYTENEQQALELGIEDVIVKPFNPQIAKLRVAKVLRHSRV